MSGLPPPPTSSGPTPPCRRRPGFFRDLEVARPAIPATPAPHRFASMPPQPPAFLGEPSDRRVTLRDIARKAGVSHVTVSRALRDDASISPSRREEIQRIAEEMGYRPDPGLTSLAAYRHRRQRAGTVRGCVALLNAWYEPERLRQLRWFQGCWQGASAAAQKTGYRLEEIHWPPSQPARRLNQILLTRGIQGLLIPSPQRMEPCASLDWDRFSVVRLSSASRDIDFHIVTSDGFRAIQMALHRMQERGYRRIGLVLNRDFDAALGGNFYGGFLAAQNHLALAALPPLLVGDDAFPARREETRAALAAWLREHRPDALLASEPWVPALLAELGLRIPGDLAVAGTNVDDLPLIDTGIVPDTTAIGRIAMETLAAQIALGARAIPAAPCRILVKCTWRDGASLPRRPGA